MQIIIDLDKQLNRVTDLRNQASRKWHETKKNAHYDEMVFHNGQINALRCIIDELFKQEKEMLKANKENKQ